MAFAAARMIKDKEAKMIAGQKRSTDINQSFSKYNLQKVKEQARVMLVLVGVELLMIFLPSLRSCFLAELTVHSIHLLLLCGGGTWYFIWEPQTEKFL